MPLPVGSPKASAAGAFPDETPVPRWSAVGLSFICHLLILILLALAFDAAEVQPEQPARRVGIVLTYRDANEQRYFEPPQEELPVEVSEARSAIEPLPSGAPPGGLPQLELELPAEWTPTSPGPGLLQLPETGQRTRNLTPGQAELQQMQAEAAQLQAARDRGGPPGEVSVFGSASAQGYRFVFIIDRSQSMGGQGLNALAAAEGELTGALARLEPHHEFQVIAYHHGLVYCHERGLLPAVPEQVARVAPFLAGLAAFGATEHERALLAALRLKPDAVFLLTDGGDPLLNEAQLQRIRREAAGRTSIHCIRFGFGPAPAEEHFMERLARQNGGSYTYVDMRARETKRP